MRIDLNADVGEGYASDVSLLPLLSSANICCGAHAGSLELTRQTIRYCQQFGVQIGAHPSYPDRANFGRHSMTLTATAFAQTITEQLRQFTTIAVEETAQVRYVKAHGALYNDLIDDMALATRFLDILQATLPTVAVMTMPHGALFTAAKARNFKVIREGFADRRYLANGRLTSRQQPGAMLSAAETATQAMRLVHGLPLDTNDGPLLLQVDSICLHGDNPHAVAQAKTIRQQLLCQGLCIVGAAE